MVNHWSAIGQPSVSHWPIIDQSVLNSWSIVVVWSVPHALYVFQIKGCAWAASQVTGWLYASSGQPLSSLRDVTMAGQRSERGFRQAIVTLGGQEGAQAAWDAAWVWWAAVPGQQNMFCVVFLVWKFCGGTRAAGGLGGFDEFCTPARFRCTLTSAAGGGSP